MRLSISWTSQDIDSYVNYVVKKSGNSPGVIDSFMPLNTGLQRKPHRCNIGGGGGGGGGGVNRSKNHPMPNEHITGDDVEISSYRLNEYESDHIRNIFY